MGAESGRVEAAGAAGGFAEHVRIEGPEPEVEILRGARCALQDRGSHPHDEEAHAEGVERGQECPFSGCEDELGHG